MNLIKIKHLLRRLGNDSARLQVGNSKLAFTTESYVVSPLFFPGGDVGTLSVTGTVNNLAMSSARPLYLSCGFIMEEGFRTDLLVQVVQSMKRAAAISGVQIVFRREPGYASRTSQLAGKQEWTCRNE